MLILIIKIYTKKFMTPNPESKVTKQALNSIQLFHLNVHEEQTIKRK